MADDSLPQTHLNGIAIISREEASAAGFKRFFIGERCKRGHIAERRVSTGRCIECLGTGRNRPLVMAKPATRF